MNCPNPEEKKMTVKQVVKHIDNLRHNNEPINIIIGGGQMTFKELVQKKRNSKNKWRLLVETSGYIYDMAIEEVSPSKKYIRFPDKWVHYWYKVEDADKKFKILEVL